MTESVRQELRRLRERTANMERGDAEIVEAICLLAETILSTLERRAYDKEVK